MAHVWEYAQSGRPEGRGVTHGSVPGVESDRSLVSINDAVLSGVYLCNPLR